MDIDVSKLSPAGQKNFKDICEGKIIYENLLKMTEDPMKYNEKFLMDILADNKDTVYGKKYDFKDIESIEDFKSKVPVTEYDDYVEYILLMSEKGDKNLICSYEVDHFSKSSGTLGNPKKIPLSINGQKIMSDYSLNYSFALIADKIGIDWIDGKSFNLIEMSLETLKSGSTYGALSAKTMLQFKDLIPLIYTSPFEAMFPEIDTNTRYLHARFALMDRDIVNITMAFLNFLLEIMRYIESDWELLVNDIEKGTIDESIKMSNEVRESLLEKISPMPERAKELRKIFEKGFNTPIVSSLWSKLSIIAGVGTGGFANYAKKLRAKYLDKDIKYFLLGLTASEGLFSVPFDLNSPDSILVPQSVFYEFRNVNDDLNNLLTLDQLEIGKDYELVITNLSGFYRYRMQDIIRVTGFYNKMPTIQFLYRLNSTVNLTGEKTTEFVLIKIFNKLEKEFNFDLVDFSLYPDHDSTPPRYRFFMEALNIPKNVSKEDMKIFIENELSNMNPSFGDKIKKNILQEIELNYLQDETYALYRDLMVMKGTSSAQLKPPRIILNEVQRKFFFALKKEE
ncbi:MAG: GH3 auxin-responsive promoter family protein [Methanobrevibacter sp.]|jgi:hypothetical protein|nr:GH3 auxin-responsive promoter family protein [Methanobrevibacter sp.]